MDKFRRNLTGKQYGLSLGKILTTKSDIGSQSRQHEIHEDRQFFCSELVAKALKVLGVIKDLNLSSTKYYPGCFEVGQKVDRNLKDGVCLGPVLNVMADCEARLDPEMKITS